MESFSGTSNHLLSEILSWNLSHLNLTTQFFHFRKKLYDRDTNVLCIDDFSAARWDSTNTNITKISTVAIKKAYVMFVHAKGTQRSLVRLNIFNIFDKIWIYILSIIFASIILYLRRCGDLAIQNDLISDYVDVIVGIVGGGRLNYRDELEKIFFGFLFLGSFFISAIGMDFFYETFLTQIPERIDSIEKLNLLPKTPIYLYDLDKNHSLVNNLRFAF